MRVVFRNGVSIDLTRLLLDDMTASLQFLDALPGATADDGDAGNRVPPLRRRVTLR